MWRFLVALQVKALVASIAILVVTFPSPFLLNAIGLGSIATMVRLLGLGLSIGAFLLVTIAQGVAKRVPSSCPACGKRVRPRVLQDNRERRGVVELCCVCGFARQFRLVAGSWGWTSERF